MTAAEDQIVLTRDCQIFWIQRRCVVMGKNLKLDSLPQTKPFDVTKALNFFQAVLSSSLK